MSAERAYPLCEPAHPCSANDNWASPSVIPFPRRSASYDYDAAGQQISMNIGVSPNLPCGVDATLESYSVTSYTERGEVERITYPNSPDTQDFYFEYDDNGNQIFAERYKDGVPSIQHTYGYNELDLPTTGQTRVVGDIDDATTDFYFYTNRRYSEEGHLSARQYPGGRWIAYNPDALGRIGNVQDLGADGALGGILSQVGNNGMLAENATYHPNGSVDRFDFGDGSGFFRQWLTAKQQPLRLRHLRNGSMLDLRYSYDDNNRITTIEDLRAATSDRTRHFSYDEVGRLIRAETQDHLHGTINYAYDALGNIRSKSYESGQYAGRNIEIQYSNKNRLHWIHDKNTAGEYDMTGKRWVGHDTRGNVKALGSLRMVYDMTNRPIQMFGKSTGTNGSDGTNFGGQTHTYDAHQRRIKTVEGSASTVRYNVFDAAGMLVQVYDATRNIRTDYVSGPNGGLARIKRIAGVDEVSFIHADWCIFCVAKIARLGTGRVGTSWGGAQAWDNEDN